MSPRPVSFGGSEFEASVIKARAGETAEALRSIEHILAAGDREALAQRAVQALAEVGREAEAAGDMETAERALTRAVEMRPRYADLHHQRGAVLMQRQKRVEARKAFDRALAINPRYVAARLDRAMLDAREGLVGEALDALAALGREATVADAAAFQQGIRSLERADWNAAESLIRRALEVSNPELQRRLERVQATLKNGDASQAARALREVLPRYESYPDLHDLMGLTELRLEHYDDALMCFARALELNPEFHSARVHLAAALDALGQSAEARVQLETVLEHEPANADAAEMVRAIGLRVMGEDAAQERA